ncbi:MAG: CDP-diacylglycerol--glycerol-3-phosphate 3-phosphatidyltransferase [Candidatus Paceibacterota bacterium]
MNTDKVVTVPNVLTLIRFLIAVGFLVLALVGPAVYTELTWGMLLILFLSGSITDYLDGWIARTWPEQATALGARIDPVADKLLVFAYVVFLWSAGIADWWLEILLFVLIGLREVFVSVYRARYGHGSLPVGWKGKWKTGWQLLALTCYGLYPFAPELSEMWSPVVLLVATGFTWWSLADYFFGGTEDTLRA